MQRIIVGCERSGTKMLAEKLGKDNGCNFVLEHKHTIASFRHHIELSKWRDYSDFIAPTIHTQPCEKHSLTTDINIYFLRWVASRWPDVAIYYIVRNGLDVVSSMINRKWGHSQNVKEYELSIEQACHQWNYVINNTWEWARINAMVVRYEDYSDIVSNPLTEEQYKIAYPLLKTNLKITNYESKLHS